MNTTLEAAIFLSMNGKAKEAIEFYITHFNAKELMLVSYQDMAKRDSSMKITEENKNYIAHSVLQLGITKLMIAEETMNTSEAYTVGNNISLCIQNADQTEIEQFYKSFTSDNRVKVILPLSNNIFSKAYGVIEDPFGIQIQLMFDDRL